MADPAPATTTKTSPTQAADTLRAAADKAADLLERLEHQIDTMRSSASGILPDGTPVEDMLADLKEMRAENARLHAKLRTIANAVSQLRASGLAGQRDAIIAICRAKGE